KSSLNDMLTYLKVNLGLIENTLEDAIDLAHQEHFNVGTVSYDDRPGEVYELTIGLGWHKHQCSDGRTYYRHGGNTNGHSAYIGFDKSALTGAIVLCNYEDINIYNFGDKILEAINKY
ncbi:MAG: serine hydrolase, partial [Bacteroidales bacterium]